MLTSSQGQSDRGAVRTYNEDAFLDDPVKRLWAVADGMGGHAAGDVASQAIVRRLGEIERPNSTAEHVDRIDDALIACNAELVRYAQEHKLDLVGSTAVVLVDAGDYMLCGWVGDSRAYQHSKDGFRALTTDHSQAQEMKDSGAFSAAEVERQEQSGALVRAVGAESRLVVQWVLANAAPGDVFLLCSDGVTKEMSDEDLAQALSTPGTAKELAHSLVETCLARGARDNTTVVVVRVGE